MTMGTVSLMAEAKSEPVTLMSATRPVASGTMAEVSGSKPTKMRVRPGEEGANSRGVNKSREM